MKEMQHSVFSIKIEMIFMIPFPTKYEGYKYYNQQLDHATKLI